MLLRWKWGALDSRVLKFFGQKWFFSLSFQPWIHPHVQSWIPLKLPFSFCQHQAIPLSVVSSDSAAFDIWMSPFYCGVFMIFFSAVHVIHFLSGCTQQKGREEQEEHPEKFKQHLRRRRTIWLNKRGWVKNQQHSFVMGNPWCRKN